MQHLLMMAQEKDELKALRAGLELNNIACSIAPFDENIYESLIQQSPELLLVEVDGNLPDSGFRDFLVDIKQERSLPIIALITGEMPRDFNDYSEIGDFITSPYDVKELVIRIQRITRTSKSTGSDNVIRCNNLVIDLTNCDVTVSGRLVELTFKEYELLKLLAAHRGRVYTREDLLNKIWSYDYYGGDRTVDVHIRRLRSKIEGPTDTFIETVRNIGYRFKK